MHDLLLQKSAGTFELIVWAEQLNRSTDLKVTFSRAPTGLQLFDPTIGSSPVQTRNETTAMNLTLSDHALVIELNLR